MMKKTLLLLAVAVFAMLPGSDLYAAQKKVLSPADTIKAFHTAMANCDFASAKKYWMPKNTRSWLPCVTI